MPRKYKSALTLLALLSLVGFAALRLVSQRSASPTLHLRDGSVWQLEHISVGTNHQRWIGANWQRPLAILPVGLAERIARKTLYERWTSPEPLLVIYSRFLTSASPHLHFTVESSNLWSGAWEVETESRVFNLGLSSWPRDSPYFDLTWSRDSRSNSKLGVLRVKNPAQTPPARRLTPLVAEATLGRVTVKLSSFTMSSRSNTRPLARAKLTLLENGTPTDKYAVRNWWLEDAFGNKSPVTDENRAGEAVELNAIPLWAPELGWTFRGELVQQSGFESHQLVTFTNVPLPAKTRSANRFTASSWAGPPALEIYTNPPPPVFNSQGPYRRYPDDGPGPGFVLRCGSTSNLFLQIIRVEGPGITLDDMEASERGSNYAVFPLSFIQERADVTCAILPVLPFTLVAVPEIIPPQISK